MGEGEKIKQMRRTDSLRDIRDQFIDIERKYSLFSWKAGGIFFWKLVRIDVFKKITEKKGVMEDGQPLSGMEKVQCFFRMIQYMIKNRSRKRLLTPHKILFLTHGRKEKRNGEYVDIYLDGLIREYHPEDIILLDRSDHYGRHYAGSERNLLYFEHAGMLGSIFYPPGLTPVRGFKQMAGDIKKVEQEIQEIFGIPINLEGLIRKRIVRFHFEKRYFQSLLAKIKPEKIYMAVAYGKEELIAAAREQGIETIEVQHGLISNYHMAYYYPYDAPVPYLPDRYILFGQYWKDSTRMADNVMAEVGRFHYITEQYDLVSTQKEETALFISQGAIGKRLQKIAVEFADKRQIRCMYKLHPSEFHDWEKKYPELQKCEKRGNITVISKQHSVYELLGLCRYVIGVCSTALYEALMFDCQAYVLPIEGYQYMDHMIEHKFIKLLPESFTVRDLLFPEKRSIEDKRYFYS